jgi:hypothetical protein
MKSAPAMSASARRIPMRIGATISLMRAKARLDHVLEDTGTKKLVYLYDFGDGWEHTIIIERLVDPEPGVFYPRIIEVRGRCPPEDCGGPLVMPNWSTLSQIPSTNAMPS